jgi:hypothetical protein
MYRYSPLVAALLAPLGMLPRPLDEILWRLVNLAVYLGALAWWSRAVLPRPLTAAQLAGLYLLIVPMSLGNLNNGQANLAVIGLLLAGTAAVAQRRWPLAGTAAALACLLKLYPLAVGLLLALVRPRRFTVCFVVALLVGLALPFVLQHPAYAAAQYRAWLSYLQFDDRTSWAPAIAYRDLRLFLTVWLACPGPGHYLALQLLGAAACAALCWAACRHGWTQRRLLTLLLALGCVWMTVLGPCTEACTYVLLAPSLAWTLMESWLEQRWVVGRVLATAGYALFLAHVIAGWMGGLTVQVHALGLHPVAALLVAAGVLANEYCWWLQTRRQVALPAEQLPARTA